MYDAFDPFDLESFSKDALKELAENIEDYLDALTEIWVFPKEAYTEKAEKRKKAALKIIREELIPKLKKGSRSVFNEPEEWNSLR